MTQKGIPYYFMRGGSSRGPFFNAKDLPKDRDALSKILIAALGSGHPLNIDGIGGGNAVTTKVAILSKSNNDDTSGAKWADVDYFFAQVSVEDRLVDYKPTCGNLMIGVAPVAIEMGMVQATGDETTVRIHAVNTGAKVESVVQTPGGFVTYSGNTAIDGVPGTAAPVAMNFSEIAGSSTGQLLPTGNVQDEIDGVPVSCVDFAMPMVIARARDLGVSGYESREELDANKAFFERMESLRLKAALLMGMGDCSKSVTPKFGLINQAQTPQADMCTRYFTVADVCIDFKDDISKTLTLEHPLGTMDVVMNRITDGEKLMPASAGLVRTARKLAQGEVFVPTELIS